MDKINIQRKCKTGKNDFYTVFPSIIAILHPYFDKELTLLFHSFIDFRKEPSLSQTQMSQKSTGNLSYEYADESIRHLCSLIHREDKRASNDILAQILYKLVLEYSNEDAEKSNILYLFFHQFEIPYYFLLDLFQNPSPDQLSYQLAIRSLSIIYIMLRQVAKLENQNRQGSLQQRHSVRLSPVNSFISLDKSLNYVKLYGEKDSSQTEVTFIPSCIQLTSNQLSSSASYSISPYVITIRKHDMIPLLVNLLKYPHRGIVQLTCTILVLLCDITPRFIDDIVKYFICSCIYTLIRNVEEAQYEDYTDVSTNTLITQILNSLKNNQSQVASEVRELYISNVWAEAKFDILYTIVNLVNHISVKRETCIEIYEGDLYQVLWNLYSEYLDNTLLSTFILSTLLRLSVPINDYSFMLSLPKKTLLSLVDNLFSTNPSLLSCSLYFIYRCIAEGQIDIWLEMEGFFDGLLNAYIGNSSNDRLLILDILHRLFQPHPMIGKNEKILDEPPYSLCPAFYSLSYAQLSSILFISPPSLYPMIALALYIRCLRTFSPSYFYYNSKYESLLQSRPTPTPSKSKSAERNNSLLDFFHKPQKQSAIDLTEVENEFSSEDPSSTRNTDTDMDSNSSILSFLKDSLKSINGTSTKIAFLDFSIANNYRLISTFQENQKYVFIDEESEVFQSIYQRIYSQYDRLENRLHQISCAQYYASLHLFEMEKDLESRVSRYLYIDGRKEWKDRVFVLTGRYLLEYKVNHTESLHKRYDLYHATIEIRKGRIGKKNAETEYITISINNHPMVSFYPYAPISLQLWYQVLLKITMNAQFLSPFEHPYDKNYDPSLDTFKIDDTEYFNCGNLRSLPLEMLMDRENSRMLNKLMIQGGIYAYQYIQKIIQMIQADGYQKVSKSLFDNGLQLSSLYQDEVYQSQLDGYIKSKRDRNYLSMLLKNKAQYVYMQQVCKTFLQKKRTAQYKPGTQRRGGIDSYRHSSVFMSHLSLLHNKPIMINQTLSNRDVYTCRNTDFNISMTILKLLEDENKHDDDKYLTFGDRDENNSITYEKNIQFERVYL